LKYLLGLLISIICSGLLIAGTIDPNVPDEKYTEYAKNFPCVLPICGINKENSNPFCASSVALRPNWIITAAHAVYKTDLCMVVVNNNRFILIDKYIIHESFDKNDKKAYYDIALCHTKEDMGLNKEDYAQFHNFKENLINKKCDISGFGIFGTFEKGAKQKELLEDMLIQRAGSNIIDYAFKDTLICSPSKIFRTTPLEFLISRGDSGGGLFIDKKLVAINSRIISFDGNPDSSYNDLSLHTKLENYIDWINKHINEKE